MQGVDDLISTRYNGTSLMTYLRSTYPYEWCVLTLGCGIALPVLTQQ